MKFIPYEIFWIYIICTSVTEFPSWSKYQGGVFQAEWCPILVDHAELVYMHHRL